MNRKLEAYLDLTRLHFFFVWPVLFCAGLFFAFQHYNGFSSYLIVQAALIGFFGFEAGFVLNDIVDADLDKKEVESGKLTKYWRPFGKRPLSQGLIPMRSAILLFSLFIVLASMVIFSLPFPHSIYVFSIMVTCYCLEFFYQIKKRNEKLPIAQLVGRIDFALFIVAGYLCIGRPDLNALLLFLFFYPLALAHLGVNDLVDVVNDRAKGMYTIPTLYGMNRTAYWVFAFSILHFAVAIIFLTALNTLAIAGFAASFLLIAVGNYLILKWKSAEAGIKALPFFHVAMLIYAISIVLSYLVIF